MNKLIQSTIITLGLLTAAVTFVQANNEPGAVEETTTITLDVSSKYEGAIETNVVRGHVITYKEYCAEQNYTGSCIKFRPLNAGKPISLKTELLTKNQKQRLRKASNGNREIVLSFMHVSARYDMVTNGYPDYLYKLMDIDLTKTGMLVEMEYIVTDILKASPLSAAVMKEQALKNQQDLSTTGMEGRILQVHRSDSSLVIGPIVVCNLTVYNAETQEQKNINIVSESMCSYAEQAILANKGFVDIEYTNDTTSLPMGMLEMMYHNLFGLEDYLLSISSKNAASIDPFHY